MTRNNPKQYRKMSLKCRLYEMKKKKNENIEKQKRRRNLTDGLSRVRKVRPKKIENIEKQKRRKNQTTDRLSRVGKAVQEKN